MSAGRSLGSPMNTRGFTEYALELSCPEAARLILTEAPGRWVPEAEGDFGLSGPEPGAGRDLLEDSRFSVGERLAALLIFAGKAEDALCAGETVPDLDPEAALDTARELAGPGELAPVLEFYKSLEILTKAWRQRLEAPMPVPWTDAHGRLARYFLDRYWLQAMSDGGNLGTGQAGGLVLSDRPLPGWGPAGDGPAFFQGDRE